MKAIKIIAILVISIFLLVVTFCHFSYEETPYPDVYIQGVGENKYELTFRYKAKVSGNMHGPSLPFSSSTHDRAKWFYVKNNTGQIDIGDVVLTHYRGCQNPLYWQKDMKGTIELSYNRVKFSIEMPRYSTPDGQSTNTVQRYVTWEHNGEYNLVDKAPPSLEILPSDYRPSSCDAYDSKNVEKQ